MPRFPLKILCFLFLAAALRAEFLPENIAAVLNV